MNTRIRRQLKRRKRLETRRTDEAYLNALGAERIPDPTTAGDFCRRFSETDILQLTEAFNQMRLRVWQQQPDEFYEVAIIEAAGSMVETGGEKKEGIGMNYLHEAMASAKSDFEHYLTRLGGQHRQANLPP